MAPRSKKSEVALGQSDIQDVDLDDANISFNFTEMTGNLNGIINDVSKRQTAAQDKLNALYQKEEILNKMVTSTNLLMEATPKENFKLIGTYQNILLKQFESLSMWQEAVMKYEDLVQRYIKMRIDLENHKLNSYAKIKGLYKATETADEGFESLLKNIHTATQQTSVADIQAMAKEQLRIQGYG